MFKKLLKFFLIFKLCFLFFGVSNAGVLEIGDRDAKIIVKVFSSLTCPHCANFHKNIFDNLKKDYLNTNKVKFEHHSFPLDIASLNAEKILRALGDNEKSFDLLEEFYNGQKEWAVGADINEINKKISKIGLKYGLSQKELDEFFNNEDIQNEILNSRIIAAKKYNITSTPTIIINEKKYEGNHTYKEFKKEIEKLL